MHERIEIPQGDDYDTVAGFVLAHTGRIPKEGETVPIPGAALRVMAVERHRITRLRIEPLPPEPQEPTEKRDGGSGES